MNRQITGPKRVLRIPEADDAPHEYFPQAVELDGEIYVYSLEDRFRVETLQMVSALVRSG